VVGSVTVTLAETAVAVEGIAQLPSIWTSREVPEEMARPSAGRRVSDTRQGVTVKKVPQIWEKLKLAPLPPEFTHRIVLTGAVPP